jgi:hypothetical protein
LILVWDSFKMLQRRGVWSKMIWEFEDAVRRRNNNKQPPVHSNTTAYAPTRSQSNQIASKCFESAHAHKSQHTHVFRGLDTSTAASKPRRRPWHLDSSLDNLDGGFDTLTAASTPRQRHHTSTAASTPRRRPWHPDSRSTWISRVKGRSRSKDSSNALRGILCSVHSYPNRTHYP